MSYEEQLKDPRWLLLRRKVIDRDFAVCQYCLSGKNLNVHHKQYIEGRMAWEYSDLYLITLCHKCHEHWHETHEIKITEFGDPMIESTEKVIRMLDDLDRLIKRHGEKVY